MRFRSLQEEFLEGWIVFFGQLWRAAVRSRFRGESLLTLRFIRSVPPRDRAWIATDNLGNLSNAVPEFE